MLRLRPRRRRLCRRGRRRRGGAEAAGPGDRRRRPDLRRDPRQRDQCRRQDQRLYRAQRRRPAARPGESTVAFNDRRRPHQLYRGARHRHRAGRSRRDQRPEPGVCRSRRRGRQRLRHRLGQEQYRPLRKRRRHRRAEQGAAAIEAPPTGAVAVRRAAQPEDRLRAHAVPGAATTGALAGQRRHADRCDLLLRRRWRQCLADRRGVCRRGGSAARRVRSVADPAVGPRQPAPDRIGVPLAGLPRQRRRSYGRDGGPGIHPAGGARGDGRAVGMRCRHRAGAAAWSGALACRRACRWGVPRARRSAGRGVRCAVVRR